MSTTAELKPVDPVSDPKAWDALIAALGEEGQPTATLAKVEELYQREVGAIIFTVMSADFDTGMSRRLYSNHPEEYPTSGYKQSAAGTVERSRLRREEALCRQHDRRDRHRLPRP
ncbi:MAG: hypothetical protein P0Y66_14160 [Candidatus Kaistia colombiensis]|nr:MAG: hypothetical protein P0Y66_14160 [Kaistia sp.]